MNLRSYMALVLVNDPLVQQELSLSLQQKREIESLVAKFLAQVTSDLEARRSLPSLSEAEKESLVARLDQERLEQIGEHDMQVASALLPAQRARLEQIALQFRQEEIFYQPDVLARLNLDERQLQRIARKRFDIKKLAESLTERHVRKELSQEQLEEALHQIRVEALATYETELTEKQRADYEQIRGRLIPFTRHDICWELRPSRVAAIPNP